MFPLGKQKLPDVLKLTRCLDTDWNTRNPGEFVGWQPKNQMGGLWSPLCPRVFPQGAFLRTHWVQFEDGPEPNLCYFIKFQKTKLFQHKFILIENCKNRARTTKRSYLLQFLSWHPSPEVMALVHRSQRHSTHAHRTREDRHENSQRQSAPIWGQGNSMAAYKPGHWLCWHPALGPGCMTGSPGCSVWVIQHQVHRYFYTNTHILFLIWFTILSVNSSHLTCNLYKDTHTVDTNTGVSSHMFLPAHKYTYEKQSEPACLLCHLQLHSTTMVSTQYFPLSSL